MSYFVGIDLGTTNTVVAYINLENSGAEPELLEIAGTNVIPSVIALSKNNEIVYGTRAKAKSEIVGDFSAYYKLGMHDSEKKYTLGDQSYSAQELSTMFLSYIRECLFQYSPIKTDADIKELVITVPAAFDAISRANTGQAVRDAGFTMFKDDNKILIAEPTAASYHANFNVNDKYVMVYDLGGGTFDCTLLDYQQEPPELISNEGSDNIRETLGGKDFDECILNYFESETGIKIDREHLIEYHRILLECEKVKIGLSVNMTTQTLSINNDLNRGRIEITRAIFDNLVADLVNNTILACQSALRVAGLAFNQIDKILLVGGSTLMPIILKTLKDKFDCDIIHANNVNTIVAIGAAKHAMALYSEDMTLIRRSLSPHCFSIISGNCEDRCYEYSVMIEKNQVLPASSRTEDEKLVA